MALGRPIRDVITSLWARDPVEAVYAYTASTRITAVRFTDIRAITDKTFAADLNAEQEAAFGNRMRAMKAHFHEACSKRISALIAPAIVLHMKLPPLTDGKRGIPFKPLFDKETEGKEKKPAFNEDAMKTIETTLQLVAAYQAEREPIYYPSLQYWQMVLAYEIFMGMH